MHWEAFAGHSPNKGLVSGIQNSSTSTTLLENRQQTPAEASLKVCRQQRRTQDPPASAGTAHHTQATDHQHCPGTGPVLKGGTVSLLPEDIQPPPQNIETSSKSQRISLPVS